MLTQMGAASSNLCCLESRDITLAPRREQDCARKMYGEGKKSSETLDVYRRNYVGRGSSVGIVARYGLEGPGIEPSCGDDIFRTRPDQTWRSPSLQYHGYRVFLPRVKRLGDGFDNPSLSSAKVTERTELRGVAEK